MRFWSLAIASLVCGPAWAQEVDGGSFDAGVAEQGELANEIDAAAGLGVKPSTAPSQNPFIRAFQSLNPDIAAIIDSNVGIAGARSYSLAEVDPDLRGGSAEQPAGFAIQEVEVAIQAVVDPYFRADLFFSIPNLRGIEVEEGFVTSSSLPANLQVKAGIFRSAIGRENGQHLHVQDFTRRQLLNEALFSPDGLRSPGLQVSWVAPLPFFLQVYGEAFSVPKPDSRPHLTTFGGGKRTDLTYTAEVKSFIPATETLSVFFGLSAAWGKSAGMEGSDGTIVREDATTLLQGADLYVKFKPANVVGGYFSLAWTTEFFLRHVLSRDSLESTAIDGSLYSQLVAQVARQWFVGLRQDLLGVPASTLQPTVSRTALSVTFAASEFARLRAYVERETLPRPGDFFLMGKPNWAAYLQLEISIGAHGAHTF